MKGIFWWIAPLVLLVLAAPISCSGPSPSAQSTGTPATLSGTLAGGATSPSPTAASRSSEAWVALRWYGHSTFLLSTSGGASLLMDPASPSTGYQVQPITGVDAVTVSHEHSDHNNVALATGSPVVIRGLKEGGDWAQVDQTVKGVRIRSIPLYHDDQKGAQRGKNAAFFFEAEGMRIVHLGDLGHLLDREQVAAFGPVDLLMVPVGGFYTIDAAAATRVVEQLSPRVVVPMHYKTPSLSPQNPIGPVDPFLQGKKVERPGGNSLRISRDGLPAETTVYLLGYGS